MSKYALVVGGSIQNIIDLDDAWYESAVASGNPKAQYYYPVVDGSLPNYDPSLEILEESLTLRGNTVVRSWNKRQKTAEELLPEPKTYTSYEFLLRFTPQERSAFRNAAKTDDTVADFMQLAQAAQEIWTNDETTIAGMNYLVSQGLLTSERKYEIMS